ncbi:glycosyltransferase [Flavobacteriaceae bacterium]|nr:glycosyltransferase [Flavobacteriaceae bacterium]
MNKKQILVSVVMITYNQEDFIRQSIESVLNQEVDFNLEVIVADDNSNDKTSSIINDIILNNKKSSCITYIRNEANVGSFKNIKNALNKVTGNFIAFCEGDDFYCKTNHLQLLIEGFLSRPDVGMVSSTYVTETSDGNITISKINKSIYNVNDIFFDRQFHISSSMIKYKDLANLLAKFKSSENLKYLLDKSIMINSALNGEILVIDNKSFYHRFQKGVTSKKKFSQEIHLEKNLCYLELTEGYSKAKKLNVMFQVDILISKINLGNDLLHFIRIFPFFKFILYYPNKLKFFQKHILKYLNV